MDFFFYFIIIIIIIAYNTMIFGFYLMVSVAFLC